MVRREAFHSTLPRGPKLPARSLAWVIALLAVAALVPPVRAAGWQPPDWTMRLEAVSSSDLFQDSVSTGQGHGASGEARVATSIRSRGSLKWSFEGNAGGLVFAQVPEANRGWMGATAGVRRGSSQLVMEGEWTPRRVKFPSAPVNAAFERWDWRLGVRQSIRKSLRLAIEGRWTRDDYVTAWDERDARQRGVYGQAALAATPALTVRFNAEIDRSDAAADRYVQREHQAAGGFGWRVHRWQLDGTVSSGVRRYPKALLTDRNFRRRDQWIGTTLAIGYGLAPGRTLVFTTSTVNQTSSRIDRAYDAQSFRLGFEWSAAEP